MADYLTSDHHFGHKNIIAYEDRPFTTVEEMDEFMIQRWNETVKPGDTVYHLGDFALVNLERIAALLKRLNGRKILILGNHDRAAHRMAEAGFDEVYKYLVLYRDDPWSHGHRNSYLLLSHRPRPFHWKGRCLNVAVECWDYRPIPLPTPQGWLLCHGHIHKSGVVSIGGI